MSTNNSNNDNNVKTSNPTNNSNNNTNNEQYNSVVSYDPTYIKHIKIYNIGIKEDPVPGMKRGKGSQSLNSSYWVNDLAKFIPSNIMELYSLLQSNYSNEEAFLFYINQANSQFMIAENQGLQTQSSRKSMLFCSWLIMIAMEIDNFEFAKYTKEERQKSKEKLFEQYATAYNNKRKSINNTTNSHNNSDTNKHNKSDEEVKSGSMPDVRVDLIPRIALERLGLHQELCVLKWGEKDAMNWKINGFPISQRVNSAKRHFDGIYSGDISEDHVAHLIWNIMALYHVAFYTHPELNDLPNLDAICEESRKKLAAAGKTSNTSI